MFFHIINLDADTTSAILSTSFKNQQTMSPVSMNTFPLNCIVMKGNNMSNNWKCVHSIMPYPEIMLNLQRFTIPI